MSNAPKVLSVDDMKTNHALIKVYLSELYEIETAMDGQQAIEQAVAWKPDIILLDVNMPVLDGYETCRRLKADQRTSHIPVIFISEASSLDDRLKGYDAGAENYVCKPFEGAELLRQIAVLLEYKNEKYSLQHDLQFASETAYSAINNASEMGYLLNFIETTFTCISTEALAKQIFISLKAYGLSGCVQFRVNQKVEDHGSNGAVTPLEKELLDRSREKRGIANCNSRSLFNSPSVSMLVRDMPIEDEDKYGRYKDHLAILLKGAEARTIHLQDMDKLRNSHEQQIKGALAEVQQDLELIDDKIKAFEKDIKIIMSDMFVDLESAVMTLSLVPEEEDMIMNIFERSRERLEDPLDLGAFIDTSFERICNKIKKLQI